MLCLGVDFACTTTGGLHPIQEEILRMMNQTLDGLMKERVQRFQQETVSASSAKEDLEHKEKSYTDAQAALASSRARAEAAEERIAESLEAQKSSKVELAKT